MRARSTLRILPRIGRIAWNSRVARLLGAAAGAVALDDEQLGFVGVARRAVGELARHRRRLEQRLAPGEVARLACRHARPRRLRRLGDDRLAPRSGAPRASRPSFSLVAFSTSDRISVLPSLVLVWPSNCGLRSFTDTIAVRPSRMSSPRRFSSFSLRRPLRPGVAVHHVGEGLLEALLVHPALGGGDVVRERVEALVVAGVPLHRDLDLAARRRCRRTR